MTVHYRVHNGPALVPILSQINPAHDLPANFFTIHLAVSSHLSKRLPSGLLPSGLLTKTLQAPPLPPPGATSDAHIILWYRRDGSRFESPQRQNFFYKMHRPVFGPSQPPVKWVPGFFPDGKTAGTSMTTHLQIVLR